MVVSGFMALAAAVFSTTGWFFAIPVFVFALATTLAVVSGLMKLKLRTKYQNKSAFLALFDTRFRCAVEEYLLGLTNEDTFLSDHLGRRVPQSVETRSVWLLSALGSALPEAVRRTLMSNLELPFHVLSAGRGTESKTELLDEVKTQWSEPLDFLYIKVESGLQEGARTDEAVEV